MGQFANFKIGRGHEKAGTLCQDRARRFALNDVQVIAVADGVGSRQYSAFGAEMMMEWAAIISTRFDLIYDGKASKEDLCSIIVKNAIRYSEQIGCDRHDLSSTASVIMVKDNKYLIFAVGDSPIVILNNDGTHRVITANGDAEFANSTYSVFSTSNIDVAVLETGKTDGIDAFYAMSDGAANVLVTEDNQIADALRLSIKDGKINLDYMNEILDYAKTKTHDDVALACISI